MKKILNCLNYCRLEIRFFAEREVRMAHWVGAVLRNNFLCAAENVCNGNGVSLRQLIEKLPLPENHFLYKQLAGGFPKGFLFDCSGLPYDSPGFVFEAGRVYSVVLVLVGKCTEYRELFAEAVRRMLANGFGHPVVPMTLVNMTEMGALRPSSVSTGDESVNVELSFLTPVCLTHLPKEGGNGFQNKLNNFPSFYQFMRSLLYRLATLAVLYADADLFANRQQMDEWIERQTVFSMRALLLRADLRYEKRYSTPKKDCSGVYTMAGYTGRLVFGNVSAACLPVLAFASALGVGGNINYGLGSFRLRYK